jgi:acyl-coenzyme A synthetase/AMP-(fatty) acid ligase
VHGRHAARLRAKDEQQVRPNLADEREDFIVGNAAAEKIHVPAARLKQVGAHLRAEFFRLVIGTGDQNALAVPRRVIRVNDIPVMGSGKIDYRAVTMIVAREAESASASVKSE